MPGAPISDVLVTGVPVSKGDFRSYENSRNRLRLSGAAEVQSLDLTGVLGIEIGQRRYNLDSGSILAHDGLNVMVDNVGNRFLIAPPDTHGTVTISTLAPSGGVDGDIWFQIL